MAWGLRTPVVDTKPTSTNTHTVTHPTGLADGDVVYIALHTSSTTVTGAPTGFVQVAVEITQSNPHLYGYRKVITNAAGEGTWTFTQSANSTSSSICIALTGIDQTTPEDTATTTGTNSTGSFTCTAPQVTTVTAGALLLYAFAVGSSTGSNLTPPGTMTEAGESAGAVRHAALDYEDRPTAGATGSRAGSFDGNNNNPWAAWMLAVRPAATSVNATLDVTATPVALPSSPETITAGATITATPTAPTLPSTSATITAGATLLVTPTIPALPATSADISAGATIAVTPTAPTLPATSADITADTTLDVTPGAPALPATSADIASGVTIASIPTAPALPATSATIEAGVTLLVTTTALALPATAATLAVGVAILATAVPVALPATTVTILVGLPMPLPVLAFIAQARTFAFTAPARTTDFIAPHRQTDFIAGED